MAEKCLLFNNKTAWEKVISSPKPGLAKDVGRSIKDFDQETWDQNKCDIVIKGNIAKFSQNPDLKEFLLNTKERVLVEASPLDIIWGVGLDQDNPNISNPYYWKGSNLLGFCLMEVRDIINSQLL